MSGRCPGQAGPVPLGMEQQGQRCRGTSALRGLGGAEFGQLLGGKHGGMNGE